MNDIILKKIYETNPNRDQSTLIRRALKLGEESGEVAQAMLAVTSENNLKGKTWDDVLEEVVDVIIVATDIALTLFPNEQITPQEKQKVILEMLDKKLEAWTSKRNQMAEKTGKVEDCT